MTAKTYTCEHPAADPSITYTEDELKWEFDANIERSENFEAWYGKQEDGFEVWLDDEGFRQVK